MLARKALAGTAGAPKAYVEEVFQTHLYTGNGSTQTITNGIDLSGKGGLVWIKRRNGIEVHFLYDTVRGVNSGLSSNNTDAAANYGTVSSFNSNGYTDNYLWSAAETVASWTFRKAEKFFDIVTYTGDGTQARAINHSLGSTPGCIIVKCYSTGGTTWFVWHRSINGGNGRLKLASTDAATSPDDGAVWGNSSTSTYVAPTSTTFTVSSNISVNNSGDTYVAYLFAHDAGGFGDSGSDNVITCGSYTGNGGSTIGTALSVSLGYEPQWLLIKAADATGAEMNWSMMDTMRGYGGENSTGNKVLYANTSGAEQANDYYGCVTPTGFKVWESNVNVNAKTYIYIAIRRGPMKTPTTGTSVFSPVTYTGNSTSNTTVQNLTTNFAGDATIIFQRVFSGQSHLAFDKLRGDKLGLYTNLSDAEEDINAYGAGQSVKFNNTQTVLTGQFTNLGNYNYSGDTFVSYNFRRAPGFFDVVCYTGTGANRTVSHNLGVVPELMIVKRRSSAEDWLTYSSATGNTKYLYINGTASAQVDSRMWNDTTPTSSVFTVGTYGGVNSSGGTFVAYLFASLSGVSKVGSYTGNGSSVTVTTDFQPRFILVKRTDSTGDWIVSDSARGLVAGNDPYLELNTADAEVTNEDWVDISSTSFTVNQTTNNANVNNGTYIYLAVS